MKYSKQRELVYQTVLESGCHPTADTIYAAVRVQEPSISLGTVYRNLGRLVEEGLLRRIVLPNTPDRFDRRLECHHHILCQQCGRLFDLETGSLFDFVQARQQIQNGSHFTVTGYTLYFTGICPDCEQHRNSIPSKPEIETERK